MDFLLDSPGSLLNKIALKFRKPFNGQEIPPGTGLHKVGKTLLKLVI